MELKRKTEKTRTGGGGGKLGDGDGGRYVLTREGPTRATRNRATRAGVIEKGERIVVVVGPRLGVGVRIDMKKKQIRKELFFPLGLFCFL